MCRDGDNPIDSMGLQRYTEHLTVIAECDALFLHVRDSQSPIGLAELSGSQRPAAAIVRCPSVPYAALPCCSHC